MEPMATDATLSEINIYPLKSAAGISVPHMDVGEVGPRYDRRWMVVDERGVFLTQRQLPRLALVTPQLRSTTLSLSAPQPGQTRTQVHPFAAQKSSSM